MIIEYKTYKYTPLMLVLFDGLKSVAEYIIKHKKPNINMACPEMRQTALHAAVLNRESLETSELLLKNGADLEAKDIQGRTPILLACIRNNTEQVKLFLRYNANIHAADTMNCTALHLLFHSLDNVDLELCKLLIENGLEPNALSFTKRTPLHFLASNCLIHNKPRVTEFLLKHGLDLNIADGFGDTPLHKATTRCPKQMHYIKYLLLKGAEIKLNQSNETFLDAFRLFSFENFAKIVKYLVLLEKKGKFQFNENIMNSINAHEGNHIFSKSIQELEVLQVTKLSEDSDLTLFDLISMDGKMIADRCDEDFLKASFENFKREDFPVFGVDIHYSFKHGLKMIECTEAIVQFLRKISKGVINPYSINLIMSYMSSFQMRKVNFLLKQDEDQVWTPNP